MTFDREDQREMFLFLIDNSNFKGSSIGNMYNLIQEIKNATMLDNLSQEKKVKELIGVSKKETEWGQSFRS